MKLVELRSFFIKVSVPSQAKPSHVSGHILCVLGILILSLYLRLFDCSESLLFSFY
jgi:hypothetical protein